MRDNLLRGVFPVFQTPFAADESIAFDQLEQEVDWIARQEVQGLVLGMVSEILRLNDSERKAVVATAVTVANEYGLPCIASVGAESTRIALMRIDDAVEVGASALMATPPLNGRNDESQLETYFSALLRHSALPLIVQDASGYVGQPLSIDVQARLFEEFGPKVMFKPEAVPVAPTLRALLEATNGAAHVFEGMGGAALLETYPGGVSGTMPGAEVCWAVAAMWRALERGDQVSALRIHESLARMIALQNDLDSFVVCEKHLLVRQGVIRSETARAPLSFELTTETVAALDHLLEELLEVVDDIATDTNSPVTSGA